MDKKFKTHDELISVLIQRNISIDTPDKRAFAKKVLQRVGYYQLINGYNKLFIDYKKPSDCYKNGTTIEEIYSLYSFDIRLKNIILKYALQVETNIKTLVAYEFSEKYGHDNYLIYTNFDTKKNGAEKHISELISDYQRQLSNRATDPAILHYLKTYGYVPLWVMNNILTFGQLSKFYSLMKQQDRQNISKIFHINDCELESILFYLSTIRNFCAHGNRLYCFRTKRPLVDLKAHMILNIPVGTNNEFSYGKRDFFACLIALCYVLPRQDFLKLIKELYRTFNDFRKNWGVISENEILQEMGMPPNWRQDLIKLSQNH